MRIVERVKVGDIINMPDQDGFAFFGFGSKLPKTIMKFVVIKVYPFYVDTICKSTGMHKSFTLGDLVMAGYERYMPPMCKNILPETAKLFKYYKGGKYGRGDYK